MTITRRNRPTATKSPLNAICAAAAKTTACHLIRPLRLGAHHIPAALTASPVSAMAAGPGS
ncbi:hypothetical protein [Streptomyces sp. SAS_270]|uniref:hypothetical protein n=1 Tax=Streptomyces sp. SAS_270 TaxID=3412748 RepID=UPI00403C6C88